jgi:hypothetical protein
LTQPTKEHKCIAAYKKTAVKMTQPWTVCINQTNNTFITKELERKTIGFFCSPEYIEMDNVVLFFYGTLYNGSSLLQDDKIPEGNCVKHPLEIIIVLYRLYGMEHTLIMMDGVFSLVLLDNTLMYEKMYVARDPLGICPLYFIEGRHYFMFSVEHPSTNGDLEDVVCHSNSFVEEPPVEEIESGSFSSFALEKGINSKWKPLITNQSYYRLPFFHHKRPPFIVGDEESFRQEYFFFLELAVQKRCLLNDDQNVGVLFQDDNIGSQQIYDVLCHLFAKSGKSIYEVQRFSVADLEDLDKSTSVFFSTGFMDAGNEFTTVRFYLEMLEFPLYSFDAQYPFLDTDFLNHRLQD